MGLGVGWFEQVRKDGFGWLDGWVFGGGRVAGWGSLMMGGLMENCILRRCVGGFEWKM